MKKEPTFADLWKAATLPQRLAIGCAFTLFAMAVLGRPLLVDAWWIAHGYYWQPIADLAFIALAFLVFYRLGAVLKWLSDRRDDWIARRIKSGGIKRG